MVTIRKAIKKDASGIRSLVWMVQINPFGLDWRRFLVAVDEQDRVVATGQIKPHRNGTRELASIATHPTYRSQGFASQIITRLLQETPRPVYLHCQEKMGPYYMRFHFRVLEVDEMPPDYARPVQMVARLRRASHRFPNLLTMKLD